MVSLATSLMIPLGFLCPLLVFMYEDVLDFNPLNSTIGTPLDSVFHYANYFFLFIAP